MISEYLTEKLLGTFLQERLGDSFDIIHNKKFPCQDVNFRPDYRIDGLGIVIEFDGYRHYNTHSLQLKDASKYSEIAKNNYTLLFLDI